MPVIAAMGAISARAFGFAGVTATCAFIGSARGAISGSVSVSLPVGTLAGDLIIVWASNAASGALQSVSGAGASWPAVVADPANALRYTSAVAVNTGSLTITGANTVDAYQVLVFRGVSALTYKSESQASSTTTINSTGFAKSIASRGVVSMLTQIQAGPGNRATVSSTGFATVGGYSGTLGSTDSAYSQAATYTSNSVVTWIGALNTATLVAANFELT